MHLYAKIYEFAATVGAFEGFVYGKDRIDPGQISNWVRNIVAAYRNLPPDVKEKLQASLDATLGRAVRSLAAALGEDHELTGELRSILVNPTAKSADDFQLNKWFQE